jgi:hypothetical protein
MFGPTRTDDGYWRIKTNQEINDLLKGQNIIWFIKKQRLNWLGHVERMTEDTNVHLSRPALGPTQPPIKWVPGLFRGRKRPGRDADPSPPSSAEV